MHAQRQLIALAAAKSALRRRIAQRRAECSVAAETILRPLAWLERVVQWGQRLLPWTGSAALALGLLTRRPPAKRAGILGTLVRWGPIVFSSLRGLVTAARRR